MWEPIEILPSKLQYLSLPRLEKVVFEENIPSSLTQLHLAPNIDPTILSSLPSLTHLSLNTFPASLILPSTLKYLKIDLEEYSELNLASFPPSLTHLNFSCEKTTVPPFPSSLIYLTYSCPSPMPDLPAGLCYLSYDSNIFKLKFFPSFFEMVNLWRR